MKKFLLSCLAVGMAFIAPVSANAVSATDLLNANEGDSEGTCAMEVLTTGYQSSGYGYYAFPYNSSGMLRLTGVSADANVITVAGLFNGNIRIQFRVSNNKMVALKDPYKQYCLNTKPATGDNGNFAGKVFQLQETYWNNGVYSDSYNEWTGYIDEQEDRYVVTFNPCSLWISNYVNMTYATKTSYNAYQLIIPKYNYNTTVKDYYLNRNREYKIYTDADWDNNKLYLINFTCRGFAIQNYQSGAAVTGEINAVYANILGGNRIEIPNQQQLTDLSGKNVLMYNLCPANASRLGASIYGTYTVEPLDHQGASRWHINSGGELATMVRMDINLDDYKIRNDAYNNEVGPWRNTTMGAEVEYTANPDFHNDVLGYSNDTIAVYTQIIEKNEDFVDHYEVVVVPGTHTSIKSSNDFIHKNHGHNKAFNISLEGEDVDYISNPKPSKVMAFANDKGTQIEKQVTFDKLRANNWNESDIAGAKKGKVSYFIKTVYNNGMEPSYHALKAPRVTTGINDIATDNNSVTISTAAGAIVVEGAEGAQVEVYTAAGVEVYAGADSEIAVEAGLYIVKVGSKVQKVVVR